MEIENNESNNAISQHFNNYIYVCVTVGNIAIFCNLYLM